MMFEQLGLIGCGLMGGSFALALKKAGLVRRVVGYSKSPSTTQLALQMGVIDREATSALQAASGSDLVLIAVPVAAIESTMKSIKHILTPNTLLMDVGSTKRNVVDAARRVLKDQVGIFVPAHPIAGKELSGVEHVDVNLYVNKQVVLTPIERTQTAHLGKATELWEALGCQVLKMSPEAHDSAYASVSHLPHMIAFAMMNAITDQAQGRQFLGLAGMGFRDFSRIAASDSKLWADVLMANREEILAQSKLFQTALQHLEHLMQTEQHDALEHEIDRASLTRAQWKMTQRK